MTAQVYALLRRNQRDGLPPVPEFHMEKLRSTLKQVVREWSAEGAAERRASYGVIVEALEAFFADRTDRAAIRVLVPGAGLGRLPFEIASRGFSCQGNEFSIFMLYVSYFFLNRVERVDQFTLYPYVHSFSNCPAQSDQLRPVSVPDVLPTSAIPVGVEYAVAAGDFFEVYGADPNEHAAWDCVVTCFFVDATPNVVTCMEIIHTLLKPGGIWINLGPLLYHYENMVNESSIELTLDEVKSVARAIGFTLVNEQMVPAMYTNNPRAMLQYTYQCAFFTATKALPLSKNPSQPQ
ncbi:N2227-like protein [Dimargaris cristalligena]|uniref:carnosine N-methyltransferase n=1 Tax=Dimargaris cristalligena TaxID=215637 RepID=A0A4P9ZKX9_9FUNG|nr:N2227-like protein [Dimargaris cristalligena]|eukprot:RKP33956.1 N2227-like protein [Dimargaris cristalligena]